MELVDYSIVLLYFIISFSIAFYYYKRASKDTNEFFLSGRNLPWYLAGLSMVATTFAADTPIAVTELVTKNGIAGNWLWWNFAFGGMLTVFFFSKLWRRAGLVTEVEFTEFRYSGKPAKFLRAFRALYLGLIMNIIIIGWVNKAMISILIGFFGVEQTLVFFYVFGVMLFVAIYSALSGLWGVVITDAFQFFMAMAGCIILAIIVVNSPQVGGINELQNKLPHTVFDFFPSISNASDASGAMVLSISSFLAYVGIIWWASWYPGAEPGGGGYVVQRMLSSKNEKHSLFATLFFQVAHYALRPWPWIIVGLSTLILYPDLSSDQKGLGYIYAMRDFLPAGIKGLLIAAFFAAYMSTVATQLNWGTSYIINDFYRRFLIIDENEKHYVLISRLVTLLIMFLSIIITLFINRISGAWEFILECGAGLGLVLILRWFWWRINAWSEISAMITPFIILPILKIYNIQFPSTLFIIVPITTLVWLAVTLLTKPTDEKVLVNFYKKVYPGGILWKKISSTLDNVPLESNFLSMFFNWVLGIILLYSALFGIGKFILGDYWNALLYLILFFLSAFLLHKNFGKEDEKNTQFSQSIMKTEDS